MQGRLDTLAQNGTTDFVHGTKPLVEIGGTGVSSSDSILLQKWAKRKIISQKIALSLIDVARRKGKQEQVKSHWNTYHCFDRVSEVQGKLFGRYCKNRICTVCSAIRKAEIINKYLPILETWEDCHFLTLTIKAIPAKQLPRYCKGLPKVFQQIVQKYRKRSQRGKGIALEGIRSFECNFNPMRRTYNPHFHIIVRTREMGKILKEEWLKRFPRKYVRPCAQYLRKVENLEQDLIEIIKYGSKIFTEMDLDKKAKGIVSPYVYALALDNILTAISGRRIFERFGFDLLADTKTSKVKTISKYHEWIYHSELRDWFNPETGEILAGYNPSKELISILNENIDTVTE